MAEKYESEGTMPASESDEAIKRSRLGTSDAKAKSVSGGAWSPDPNFQDRVMEFVNDEDRAPSFDPVEIWKKEGAEREKRASLEDTSAN